MLSVLQGIRGSMRILVDSLQHTVEEGMNGGGLGRRQRQGAAMAQSIATALLFLVSFTLIPWPSGAGWSQALNLVVARLPGLHSQQDQRVPPSGLVRGPCRCSFWSPTDTPVSGPFRSGRRWPDHPPARSGGSQANPLFTP